MAAPLGRRSTMALRQDAPRATSIFLAALPSRAEVYEQVEYRGFGVATTNPLDYHRRAAGVVAMHRRDTVGFPHRSVATLMVVVAVVAVNLGIARVVFAYNPVLLEGVVLSGLALQAGGLLLARSRGRIRAFWIGFLAFGSMAMATVVWAMVFAPNVGIAHDPITGNEIIINVPGSLMWTLWSGYFRYVLTYVAGHLDVDPEPVGVITALIWSLPQFLVAVVGGLLCRLVAGRRQWRPARSSSMGDDKPAHSSSACIQAA
jgi:hypothetical protein